MKPLIEDVTNRLKERKETVSVAETVSHELPEPDQKPKKSAETER